MENNISKFLEDFQDNYLDVNVDFSNLDENLNKLDLRSIDVYLNKLNDNILILNDLSMNASKDALIHYRKVLDILDKKIDYIGDTADIYNYINSYFDMKTVKDIYNFNLQESMTNTCIYDYTRGGLSLKSINTLYNCPKEIEGNTIIFYNTNNSIHSGFHIISEYLDVLKITRISIRKSDGTMLELEIKDVGSKEYYIDHELLVSSQIILSFTPLSSNETLNTYLQSVSLNLINYSYETEGYVPIGIAKLESSDLFSIIANVTTPTDTYVNINVGMELIDINDNTIEIINIACPLNNSLVCKRLDRINFNEVDYIENLIVKGKKTKSNLSEDYLNSLEFKNEKYIIYKPKELKESSLNRYITKLGNSSFKTNSRIIKKIRFSPTLELFSFKEGLSPLVKHLTGVTKNETI